MASDAPRNPFAPGPGTSPPVLAGREAERRRLQAIVEDLHARCSGPVHLLQAPRGMGKTVLLRDLQQAAPAAVHWMTGADLSDLPCLARELADPAGRAALDVAGAAAGVPGVQRRAPDLSWWKQKIKTRLRGGREPRRILDRAGIAPDDAGLAKGIIAGNGFLTRSGDDWRAGIPSLADYVRRHPR